MPSSQSSGPLTCPNGHAMDEGLFECPACGAYRPSANDPDAIVKNGRVLGSKKTYREHASDYARGGAQIVQGFTRGR